MESVKPADVIDLEQFRGALVALSDYAYERHGNMDHPHCLEADRLLALIDGQANVRSCSEHSSEVAADLVTDDKPTPCDLCRVRDEVVSDDDGISFCQECLDVWRESWQPINDEVE